MSPSTRTPRIRGAPGRPALRSRPRPARPLASSRPRPMGGVPLTGRRPPIRRPWTPGRSGPRRRYRRRPWSYRRRRPWLYRRRWGGWWGYPAGWVSSPIWAEPDAIPAGAAFGVAAAYGMAGLERFSPAARASLRRLGLLRGVWPRRLAAAPPGLVRFINRFHHVAGVEEVIRDLYAGSGRKARALLAIRFARRIADRFPDSPHSISFQRSLALGPGGDIIPAVELVDERSGLRYLFKPWRQLDPRRIVAHFLRDVRLHGGTLKVRWVFDGRRLGMAKTGVVRTLRRALAHPAFTPRGHPMLPAWLERMDQIVVVVDPR